MGVGGGHSVQHCSLSSGHMPHTLLIPVRQDWVWRILSSTQALVNTLSLKVSCWNWLVGAGFTLLFMGVFSFSCTLCSLTTNLALFGIELFLTLTFTLLASSFFASAEASPVAHNLQVVRVPSSHVPILYVFADSLPTGWWRLCFCSCHVWMVPLFCLDVSFCELSHTTSSRGSEPYF